MVRLHAPVSLQPVKCAYIHMYALPACMLAKIVKLNLCLLICEQYTLVSPPNATCLGSNVDSLVYVQYVCEQHSSCIKLIQMHNTISHPCMQAQFWVYIFSTLHSSCMCMYNYMYIHLLSQYLYIAVQYCIASIYIYMCVPAHNISRTIYYI